MGNISNAYGIWYAECRWPEVANVVTCDNQKPGTPSSTF